MRGTEVIQGVILIVCAISMACLGMLTFPTRVVACGDLADEAPTPGIRMSCPTHTPANISMPVLACSHALTAICDRVPCMLQMPALVIQDASGKVIRSLYESFAITAYLAKKHSSPAKEGVGNKGIGGRTAEEDAEISQWSLWVITELETPILALLMKKGGAQEHQTALVRPLQALEVHLTEGGKQFLVGDRFTVADLNVGSILGTWGLRAKLDWKEYPRCHQYAKAMTGRPACRVPKPSKASL